MAFQHLGHARATHSLIGIGAAIAGVFLGMGIVYLDTRDDQTLAVYAASGSCQQLEDACKSKPGATEASCHSVWLNCMNPKCNLPGTGAGQCNKDPECQAACTESATSQGGKISCCKGGPQHNNQCKDEVDGKCNPMPMGGMPPMLPMIPMKMPSMNMPMPTPSECGQTESRTSSTSPDCPKPGVSGLLTNLFDTNTGSSTATTSSGNSVLNALTSIANTFTDFFKDDTAVTNPTVASVTPVVVSGTNTGGITPGGVGTPPGSAAVGSGAINPAVTGFGSTGGAADTTSSGPILNAITSIIQKIQGLLSSIF